MKKISIIICTNKKKCLNKQMLALLKNNPEEIQLIFIKQANLPKIYQKENLIKEIVSNKTGVSNSRNTAIREVVDQTDIIAFTDDDCIPDQNWIKEIKKFFKDKQVQVVFGKTKPFQPQLHKKQICPCTFSKKSQKPINKICQHWKHIGFSNNMAIRPEVFKKIGIFKWWLGPGSIGSNGEDAELILRMLLAGYKINYNPKMIIYHNKWLNSTQMKKQLYSYNCGGIAVYGYYSFRGIKDCQPMLTFFIKSFFINIMEDINNIFKYPSKFFYYIYTIFNELTHLLRGLITAFIFASLLPLFKK